MSKIIYTRKGHEIIVDDRDYEALNKHNWHAKKGRRTYYARRYSPSVKGVQANMRMHRAIMGAQKGQQVDHINGDGLDNRRENLRLCTNAQNQQNARPTRGGSSEHKGASLHKATGKWLAQITVKRKRIYLGLHATEEDAARAYDKAATEHFGEFARINFPIRTGAPDDN